ncbi:DUF6059 family protein [Streptomyces sp. NBC_01190]|uniref:DUF6059 family protein n=1 Tax=Streptomyces sp. NBC_01190 TaxID=2903767 RepID=UPI0038651071|nr:hypothetical protein OG519_02315 [Streptomyces sp. NBC_01190]
MRRWRRDGRRLVIDRCLRPVWNSLMTLGMIQLGPLIDGDPRLSAWPEALTPAARPGPAARWPSVPGAGGPAAGHPERLCPEVPLSRPEQLIALDLWPAGRVDLTGPLEG